MKNWFKVKELCNFSCPPVASTTVKSTTTTSGTSLPVDSWNEVGAKNRKVATLHNVFWVWVWLFVKIPTLSSPISRIFNGKMRSILQCPGSKDSVTIEPFHAIQLDISVYFWIFLIVDIVLVAKWCHHHRTSPPKTCRPRNHQRLHLLIQQQSWRVQANSLWITSCHPHNSPKKIRIYSRGHAKAP